MDREEVDEMRSPGDGDTHHSHISFMSAQSLEKSDVFGFVIVDPHSIQDWIYHGSRDRVIFVLGKVKDNLSAVLDYHKTVVATLEDVHMNVPNSLNTAAVLNVDVGRPRLERLKIKGKAVARRSQEARRRSQEARRRSQEARRRSQKPAVAPKKPAVAPKKPAVAPKKPAVAPKKPAVAPKKPADAPKPEKPAVKPAVAPEKTSKKVSFNVCSEFVGKVTMTPAAAKKPAVAHNKVVLYRLMKYTRKHCRIQIHRHHNILKFYLATFKWYRNVKMAHLRPERAERAT
ncbi:hypothetical protein L596_025996 [Steinernema carpocapsae]|uniref:Uncharacterized protein n=1 Tax=Steinernema carpocapsae TaxID=34508 RepID=A0A4U5M009_STECR|nr:hypothetical protein L596_025996 [Steinernema carpocapsae]